MIRRLSCLVAAFLVFNLAGCALLDIALYPIQLLFGLLGSGAKAVGIADAGPAGSPRPAVADLGGDRWRVTGLDPAVPYTIVCTEEGCEPRTFAWPGDFARHGENVVVAFERSR